MEAFTPIKDIVEKYQVSVEWLVEQAVACKIKFWVNIDVSDCHDIKDIRDEHNFVGRQWVFLLHFDVKRLLYHEKIFCEYFQYGNFNGPLLATPRNLGYTPPILDAYFHKDEESQALLTLKLTSKSLKEYGERLSRIKRLPKPENDEELLKAIEKIDSTSERKEINREDLFLSLEDFRRIEAEHPELTVKKEIPKNAKKKPGPKIENADINIIAGLLAIIQEETSLKSNEAIYKRFSNIPKYKKDGINTLKARFKAAREILPTLNEADHPSGGT